MLANDDDDDDVTVLISNKLQKSSNIDNDSLSEERNKITASSHATKIPPIVPTNDKGKDTPRQIPSIMLTNNAPSDIITITTPPSVALT